MSVTYKIYRSKLSLILESLFYTVDKYYEYVAIDISVFPDFIIGKFGK